jgi:hypothetical protein
MPLSKSLKKIAASLNKLSEKDIIKGYALVGGLSLSVWGLPRATKDIDILVALHSINDLGNFSEILKEKGLRAKLFRGGISDPVPYLLKAFDENVPIDMIIAARKWEYEAVEKAVGVDFKGLKIPVISPELLVIMKLKAGGPIDLLDASGLIRKKDIDMEFIEKKAKELRLSKKLERLRKL